MKEKKISCSINGINFTFNKEYDFWDRHHFITKIKTKKKPEIVKDLVNTFGCSKTTAYGDIRYWNEINDGVKIC